MTTNKPTSSVQEQMAELDEAMKKEKVKLTPEVEGYIREHVRAVQDKLQNGEDVYEEDLAFIGEVRVWVGMPEKWRKKYVSIEEMRVSEERTEASERGISLRQWLDVLHVAEAKKEEKEWIDKTFTFPGGGKIEVRGYLNLKGCTSLTELPEGLTVGENLDLSGCTSLTELPEGLKVEGYLYLKGCTSLTSLSEWLAVGLDLSLDNCTSLTSLSEGLAVSGYLDLKGCTSLTSLPEGLAVGWNLNLNNCTGLISLPEGLRVDGNLYLSENLHAQVKKDAERLKQEGKIKGGIKYHF